MNLTAAVFVQFPYKKEILFLSPVIGRDTCPLTLWI